MIRQRDGRPGFNSRQELGLICLPPRPDRLWGPPSLLRNGYWGLSPGIMRQGCGADLSPQSSVETNVWIYTSTSPYTLMARCLVKHRDNSTKKIKVKLSLCFFSQAPSHEDVLGSGGIAPRILDLGTRWRWVVSFTALPLYPQGKRTWYPLDRRLGGPQSGQFYLYLYIPQVVKVDA
jgi:hypothetical protein